MRAKRVKFISGGGGGGDDDEGDFGLLGAEEEEEDGEQEDIKYQNVIAVAAAEDEDEDDDLQKNVEEKDKTLLQLTHGINGETAKQRIESAVYQFAVGVMFVRKCLVANCIGVSDTYTFDTELKQFYASHPHLREQLGPGHVPPGSSGGGNEDDGHHSHKDNDNDDDDMYIPQLK
jgi:hypothetical protein